MRLASAIKVLVGVGYCVFLAVGSWWQDFSRQRRAEDDWWETLRRGALHDDERRQE